MWTAAIVVGMIGCLVGGLMRAKEAFSKSGKAAREAKLQSAISFSCSGILALTLFTQIGN